VNMSTDMAGTEIFMQAPSGLSGRVVSCDGARRF
jgi:hypothetical protein